MRLLLSIVLLLNIQIGIGQTVSLPDTNLRNKLITSYPFVMQGKELDTTKAAAYKGVLDLRFANIADATGVQYFVGISTLNLSFNQLATIPSISGLVNLNNFYANYNKLTLLPDMQSLTQLHDFQVMNNQLTALPSLSGSALWLLYCSSNKITQFPSLTQFTQLMNLVIGDNPYKNTIDFSHCPNLVELHVHRTGTDTIIGLEKLKKLTTIYAWGNNIRNFSALDSITTLTTCFVFDNPIENLPYLGNKPNLSTLKVANCHLTFEDILPVLQQSPPANFSYTPQRTVVIEDVTARAATILSLKYPVDIPASSNVYVWLKNGIVTDSSTSDQFILNPLAFSDSGNYSLKIYNTVVTDLVLMSNTFHVIVKPCMELTFPIIHIVNKECARGYTIDLSNAQVIGGKAPFLYDLTNGVYHETSSNTLIENLPAGHYNLTLSDTRKCTANYRFVLDHIEKCDPVMTPNGDGVADSYFIEKTGTVKIYDLKRKLIKTMTAPVVWDGTDQHGALLDAGYYVIDIDNETPVYITIIR